MKGPVQSVEVSFFVHATEDLEKVEARVTESLKIEGAPEVEELEGHFGNGIRRVTYHLVSEEAAKVFATMSKDLADEARGTLVAELDEHVDEHQALYLRLDKQGLMEGRLELGSDDAVRVKVKPRLFSLKGGARRFYLEALRSRG